MKDEVNQPAEPRVVIFTVGHSTRSPDQFVELLREYMPFSRYNAKPHTLMPMAKVHGTRITYPS